jgi:SPP1 gp7 family putative phage head morphogenesis protein
MTGSRKNIEDLKDKLAKQIESDVLRFKRAIIRQIDFLARKNKIEGSVDIQKLARQITNQLRIPVVIQNLLVKDLKTTQEQIAEIWDLYFEKELKAGEQITFSDADYEKLRAAYKIDFSSVEDKLSFSVEQEFTKILRSDSSYSNLRSKLRQKDIGEFEASTLANTAVAQFDNAYMIENAQQAGVTKYLYDGTIIATTRDFCRERVGKIFTLQELEAMDNGQGLPVIPSLGGYNCRHYLTPIVEEI